MKKAIRRTGVAVAVLILVLAIGYVGEQDRQYELLNAGYTLEEIR